MTLRFPVVPMKATLGTLPTGDGWAHEIKWDGYRTLVHIDNGTVRLQSPAGHDVTDRWPELHRLGEAINADSAIVDGELVALDHDGRPRFDLIQGSGRGSDHQAALFLFDVLRVEQTDTIDLPYLDRRRLLDSLIEPSDNWQVPRHHIGDGAALVAATVEQELEGVVSKRVDSVYRPGARAKEWRKVKNRRVAEVAIGGFTAGTGGRASSFGALLVGRWDNNVLSFAGGVGTGFDAPTLTDLRTRLDALTVEATPFDPVPPAAYRRGATWVRPELTARIELAEFTNDGYVRHASYVELV